MLGVEFERSLCYVTVKERNREIITLGCVCELTRQREREREREREGVRLFYAEKCLYIV